jgi:hypothetical protein
MKNIESLTLIEGTFSPDETNEILSNVINSKINFHTAKNWSSQERFGKDDEASQKRIPALIKEMEKLQAILVAAKANNKKVVVSSQIIISLSNDL